MTAPDRAAMRAAARAHERARTLSAAAIDGDLSQSSAAWLAAHLNACDECAIVAAEYRSLHDELRALARPEPPRDLWARTSAALDGVDRSRAHGGTAGLRLILSRNRYLVGSALAAGLAIAIVSASLFSQSGPLANPAHGSPSANQIAAVSPSAAGVAQDPVAVVDGKSIWVAPSNGVLQIRGGSAECSGAADKCTVASDTSTLLGSISSKSSVSVVIAPDVHQAAVWTSSKIVILPLANSAPQTVSLDLLTPRPVGAVPSVAPTLAATPKPTPVASDASPAATNEATPVVTAAPTTRPVESQAALPTQNAGQPIAILDSYRVVGRAPEFSANGLWVAFSARPDSQASGSDVFVWRVGWERAVAVTSGHDDLFAGWLGGRILISQFGSAQSRAAGSAVSWVYDPTSGTASLIDRPMLLPVVDPTGRYVVYWSGTVKFDAASGLWVPDQGDLYFDLWSNLTLTQAQMSGASPTPAATPTAVPTAPAQVTPGPTEVAATTAPDQVQPQAKVATATDIAPSAGDTAGLPQMLALLSTPGTVKTWAVRWDATGRYVAIWIGTGAGDTGIVTLLNVIPGTQMLNTSGVLLSKTARSNIQFDADHFVYTSPGQGGAAGTTYSVELPSVPPTPPTPVPTPAASPTDQTVAPSPAPSSTVPPTN
jgi:hypothetical protein